MINDMGGRSCDAGERAVARAGAVARATRGWEWWIIIGSAAYLLGHLIEWYRTGFRVVGL